MLCGTRTSGLDNLTQGPISSAHVSFDRIRQVAPTWAAPSNAGFLGPLRVCSDPPTGHHTASVLELQFGFAKIKGAKITLHANSPIFRAAKLKVFTVYVIASIALHMRAYIYIHTVSQKKQDT